jgi:uncharacterized protein (TIGR02266 family)
MDQNLREHERVSTDFFVRVRIPETDVEEKGNCRNLSCGGLFLEMKRPPPRGTPLRLILQLGPVGEIVEADAIVVWSRPAMPDPQFPPGVGLRFTEISDDAQYQIAQTIRKQKERQSSSTGGNSLD